MFEILFPKKCIFCGKIGKYKFYNVCKSCYDKIDFCSNYECCTRCGTPQISMGEEKLCYDCMTRTYFPCKKIASVGAYRNDFRNCILRFKNGKNSYGKTLAYFMNRRINEEYKDMVFDIVVPVPFDKSRINSRGYSSSHILGKEISRLTKIPFVGNGIKKIRKTPKQTSLKYRERIENLTDAFRGNEDKVKGKTVLLVDDVCTTGSTLRECARALKRAGAKVVCGITAGTTVRIIEKINK